MITPTLALPVGIDPDRGNSDITLTRARTVILIAPAPTPTGKMPHDAHATGTVRHCT